MTEKLTCEKHGEQNEAIICIHLVNTLTDRKPRGFIWSRDDDGSINAYCIGCKDMVDRAGGEWTEALQDKAGLAIACEACIMPLFELNGQTRPA